LAPDAAAPAAAAPAAAAPAAAAPRWIETRWEEGHPGRRGARLSGSQLGIVGRAFASGGPSGTPTQTLAIVLHTEKMVLLATKLGTTDKIFVAATKNFAASTKRFVDRT